MDLIENFNAILKSFKIRAVCVDYKKVDNYFYYDLKLSPDFRVKNLQKYGDELSLILRAVGKPSIKVLHHEGVVRLEFAASQKHSLKLFNYFSNINIPKGNINCLLGQSVDGKKVWMDLSNNPHMIVSGTTGSGKSTLLHNIIANLLNYNNVDLHLLDPKRIEFSEYEKLNCINLHYTYEEAVLLMNNLLETMEFRYKLIRDGITSASQLKPVVVIIDEFADLIMQDREDQFYLSLCRLAQKCRAAKIYIILATQRPSVNIVNGTIKANFPARISCRVASHVDSKVILDATGAENLFGQGDALIRDNFRFLERFQIAYTNAEEVCYYFGNQC